MEHDSCPRCELATLVIDDDEGFLLCPNCGYVAEEHGLVDQQVYNQETGFGAVLVEDAQGQGVATKVGDGWSHAVGRSSQTWTASYLRGIKDKLQAVSSRLPVPTRLKEESSNILQQVYNSKAIYLGRPGYTEALCAAVLLLVLRLDKQPASLMEVAVAAGVPKQLAAHMYRRLIAMPAFSHAELAGTQTDSLLRPSCSLRAFCFRHAADVVRNAHRPLGACSHNTPSSTETAGSTAVTGQQGSGGGSEQEEDVRKHPFVKAAMEVADIIAKTGATEGRPPSVVAGGILLLLGSAPDMYKVYGLTPGAIATQIGCAAGVATTTKTFIANELLKLAAVLPLGADMNVKNVASYLPLIISTAHTVVAIKRQERAQQQQAQAQALLPQQLQPPQQQGQPAVPLLPQPLEQSPMRLLPQQQQTQQQQPPMPLLPQRQQGQHQEGKEEGKEKGLAQQLGRDSTSPTTQQGDADLGVQKVTRKRAAQEGQLPDVSDKRRGSKDASRRYVEHSVDYGKGLCLNSSHLVLPALPVSHLQ